MAAESAKFIFEFKPRVTSREGEEFLADRQDSPQAEAKASAAFAVVFSEAEH
jgi:hypothetical protein